MSSTRISHRVNAPRAIVYRALLDAGEAASWMVPTGITSHVHAFDAREPGMIPQFLPFCQIVCDRDSTQET